ncbi:hypothetical protein [Psychrosphaera algicola]|uniref:Uncharacterized protein n=1 Tax=Psychrosphaera algicola TaxID=3023714 RepID=A0ABT5FIS0_9GAMM|nr:hypothetical protein [Psychrosphaera sp. G1-22]MDC2891105.1 hypothetical protein [Psychrosphaera sp. G1-22]
MIRMISVLFCCFMSWQTIAQATVVADEISPSIDPALAALIQQFPKQNYEKCRNW